MSLVRRQWRCSLNLTLVLEGVEPMLRSVTSKTIVGDLFEVAFGNVGRVFGCVAKQGGADQYGQSDGCGHGTKPNNQDLVQHGPALQGREVDHRSKRDAAGAERRPKRGSVDPLVEGPSRKQPSEPIRVTAAPDKKESAVRAPPRPAACAMPLIRSPRRAAGIWPSATVPTKPSRAMTRAASK